PFASMTCPRSATSPAAEFTSGSARTRPSRLAGNDGGSPTLDLKASLPAMTASLRAYERVKIVSNAFVTESVRTKVPQIIATPSTIASAVRKDRKRRVARPLRATPVIVLPAELLHRREHLLRRRGFDLAHDQAVREEEDAIGDRGGARVVRD